jgi:hypothetical protein
LVDGVRDAAFECSEGFFVGFAFVDLAVVVDLARCLVADLGDGGRVDGVVQGAVPAP